MTLKAFGDVIVKGHSEAPVMDVRTCMRGREKSSLLEVVILICMLCSRSLRSRVGLKRKPQ